MRVVVALYDDRGDPTPPENYRVEILVAGTTFSPARYPEFTTKEVAEALARRVRAELKAALQEDS